MNQFLYLDGLNEIERQVCELAADNRHQRAHQRDFMLEIRMLDQLSYQQQIALAFAGLRRFEIENEIEELEAAMARVLFIDEDLATGITSISWFDYQRIRMVQFIRRNLIECLRRDLS